MKKICYVVTIPLTIRSFFIPQLKFLANHGFEVSVICSPDNTIAFELGDEIRFIPVYIPRGISVVGSIKAVLELWRIFKNEKFDLVQYSTPNAALYASITAKSVGCNVRNYHLMGLRYQGASGIGKIILNALEKLICTLSTSVECVSHSNMEIGIKEGLFPREKATVVWNGSTGGVDLERFNFSNRERWRNEVRKELGFSSDDFVYGFIGRITKDKGINELLEAYFSLNTDAKLLFVGPQNEMQTLDEELLKKAKEHPYVFFHDIVRDVERYYAAIDVLILPSYREGFGNVVIEAAAVGTPAIVSDIPGPVDAIKCGQTGLVVPAKNAEALAEAMRNIEGIDYVAMGQKAVEFAKEKFDHSMLCEKILERKIELLGEKP